MRLDTNRMLPDKESVHTALGGLEKVFKPERVQNLKGVMMEHGIGWDSTHYYTPDFKVNQELQRLDLKDKTAIRDYITYVVNKAYLDYCKKNEVKPKGMISIPQHFTNYYEKLLEIGIDEKRLIEYIDQCIQSYISEDVVYFTCYDKQIRNAYNDIMKVTQTGLSNYHTLIPDYKDANTDFKFDSIEIRDISDAQDRDIYDDKCKKIMSQIKIAETVIKATIPPKYLVHPQISVNDKACLVIGEEKRYRALYIPRLDTMVIHSMAHFDSVIHEYLHSILNWKNGCHEVSQAVWDYVYEETKCVPIYQYRNSSGTDILFKFKPFGNSSIGIYDPYFTKLPPGENETYSDSSEFLSMLIQTLVKKDIELMNGSLVDAKSREVCSIQDIFAEQFDYLCKKDQNTAAMVLTFFRGEFK